MRLTRLAWADYRSLDDLAILKGLEPFTQLFPARMGCRTDVMRPQMVDADQQRSTGRKGFTVGAVPLRESEKLRVDG